MSRLAVITFITRDGLDVDNGLPTAPVYPSHGLPGTGPVDPGWGVPTRPPVDPGYSRPGGGGRPDNSLPWVPPPGHIATLPVFPFDPTKPDNELPGTPGGGHPDQGLPPIQIKPGVKFVVKWLACFGLILVPDNELPETPEPK
jgi:hypothetical protein